MSLLFRIFFFNSFQCALLFLLALCSSLILFKLLRNKGSTALTSALCFKSKHIAPLRIQHLFLTLKEMGNYFYMALLLFWEKANFSFMHFHGIREEQCQLEPLSIKCFFVRLSIEVVHVTKPLIRQQLFVPMA